MSFCVCCFKILVVVFVFSFWDNQLSESVSLGCPPRRKSPPGEDLWIRFAELGSRQDEGGHFGWLRRLDFQGGCECFKWDIVVYNVQLGVLLNSIVG